MNIINSTWAYKCKRYPDGLIKKFKARFCARGDQQLHGIDFFETYAPVVQWTTIRLMFVLEVLLGLKSLQGELLISTEESILFLRMKKKVMTLVRRIHLVQNQVMK